MSNTSPQENTVDGAPLVPSRPRGVMFAVALGALGFVVTPLASTVLLLPFVLLSKFNEALNPIEIVARLTRLEDSGLGGFFLVVMILVVGMVLVGSALTVFLCRRAVHSRKLAVITFISALGLQLAVGAVVFIFTMQRAQSTMQEGIEQERAYQQYARIGEIVYSAHEPYTDWQAVNGQMVQTSLYRRLVISIPVSVAQAGTYQAGIRYSGDAAGTVNLATTRKQVVQELGVGAQVMTAEFQFAESGGYGYLTPKTAQVELYYLASKEEILGQMRSGSANTREREIVEQFVKEQGLEDSGLDGESTFRKFVERKEVQFAP